MSDASEGNIRRRPMRAASRATAASTTGTAAVRATTAQPPPSGARAAPRRPRSGFDWRTTFGSLENRDFLYLWLGMLVMMGGMQMQMIARGYLAYDLTSSPFLLGVVNSGFAVPLLALSLFGGAFADRLERKYIIQFGQGMAALLSIIIGVAIHLDVVAWYHLWIASIVQGSLFAFLMPARQAIIPQLVGQDRLSNAMALNAAAMSAMTLFAPALAGWAYAYLGPYNVYYIISGLAIIAFLLSGMLPKTGTGAGRRPAPVMGDILAGLVYIRHSPIVLILLLMGLATSLLAMPFRFLMPLFVVDVYRMGPEAMGLLVTIMGGGSLVGALFIASIGQSRRGMLLLVGSFMSGIALLLIAVIPVYNIAAALMILLGLGDAGRRTLNQSLIMEEVEDQYRGRVMSVFMLNFGLMPLGVLPAGTAAEYLGGQAVVGILALLLLGVTTLVLVTQRRLREMP